MSYKKQRLSLNKSFEGTQQWSQKFSQLRNQASCKTPVSTSKLWDYFVKPVLRFAYPGLKRKLDIKAFCEWDYNSQQKHLINVKIICFSWKRNWDPFETLKSTKQPEYPSIYIVLRHAMCETWKTDTAQASILFPFSFIV